MLKCIKFDPNVYQCFLISNIEISCIVIQSLRIQTQKWSTLLAVYVHTQVALSSYIHHHRHGAENTPRIFTEKMCVCVCLYVVCSMFMWNFLCARVFAKKCAKSIYPVYVTRMNLENICRNSQMHVVCVSP